MKLLSEMINESYKTSDETLSIYNEIRRKFDTGELDCGDNKYKKSEVVRPSKLHYGDEFFIFMKVPEEYKMRYKNDLDDNNVISDTWCALGVADLFGRIYIQGSKYGARLKWKEMPKDNFRHRFSKKSAGWYLNIGKEERDDFLDVPVEVCVHNAKDFIKEFEK